jgi:surfactin family lipopeptide synthetase A
MITGESADSRVGTGEPTFASLSPAQRGIWFLDKAGSGGAYNIARARRLKGPLDIGLLEEAHRFVVGRHDILRTRYVEFEGVPFQVVDPPESVDFEVVRMSEGEIDLYLESEAARSFDLAADRMWRVRVVRLREDDHILLDVVHHIAADGWSFPMMRSEAGAYYQAATQGQILDLPPAAQYRDISESRTTTRDGDALADHLDYWTAALDGAPDVMALPSDWPGAAVRSSDGFWVTAMVPDLTEAEFERFASELDATQSMVGLSVFASALARYGRTSDMVVGIPVTGRADPNTEGVVGPFFNSLPIRLRVEPEVSFRDLVAQTRGRVLDALDHEVPFDEIVKAIDPPRSPGQTPVFQVMFQHRDSSLRGGYGLPGISEESLEFAGRTTKFNLLLEIAGRDGGVEMSLNLSGDLYDRSTGTHLVEGVAELARQAIAAPDEPLRASSMTSASERARLMSRFADNDRLLPKVNSLADHYEQQVARKGSEVAISSDDEITHDELISVSREIESRLVSAGVTPGSVVGLSMERSAVMVAAMLAINRLGAVYVPIDPDYPEERIRRITEISGAKVMLVAGDGPEWSRVSILPLEGEHKTYDPSSKAVYVMFTSGSTGAPKGVVVGEEAVLRLVCSSDYVSVGSGDVVAHLSNVAFDAATFEIWAPLLNGATVAIVNRETVLSPEALHRELTGREVTTIFVTTALFNLISRQRPDMFSGMREVLFGGERCDPSAVQRVIDAGPPRRLLHVYGPTETTTFATWYEVPLDRPVAGTVPIGGPITNTKLYVLDGWGKPLPPGLVGELHVGGLGVALGYAGDPAETQTRFSADPFSDDPWGRMYRTGDLVRVTEDGDIDFVGRADRQVKLRGFRIELAEIETALLSHPSVEDAVVRMVEDDDPRLVAWVSTGGAALAESELKRHVSAVLPGFMVPAIVPVDTVPIGATGKIDTSRLPMTRQESTGAKAASETERRVIELFEKVLALNSVGRSDDFFELGGHSIRAVELVALIEKRFGRRMGVVEMMEGPTPAEIAARIDTGNFGDLERGLVTMAEGAGDPLFVFHHPSGTVQAYSDLVRSLPGGIRVIGVNASGVDGTIQPSESLVEMAAEYASLLASAHPQGHFQLIGHSLGGLLAWETARQLTAADRHVAFLGLIDTQLPRHLSLSSVITDGPNSIVQLARDAYRRARRLAGDVRWGSRRLWHEMRDRPLPADLARTGLVRASSKAFDSYQPRPVETEVAYFLATGAVGSEGGKIQPGWSELCPTLEVVRVPGMHSGPNSILTPPNVATLAEELALRVPTGARVATGR